MACVAAASVLAKVTRDRIMTALHDEHPVYGFDVHKGYTTEEHGAALTEYGPSEVHRWSYANVAKAAARHGACPPREVLLSAAALHASVPVRARDTRVSENGASADNGLRGGARIS